MINKLLHDREKRYNRILELIDAYKLPVVSGKVNYPGIDKNTDVAHKIFNILEKLLFIHYDQSIEFSQAMGGLDGKSLIMVVSMTPIKAKEIAISIEENNDLGRLFDIDIYSKTNGPISRKDLDLPTRKCILCEEDARICGKLKKHKISEILDKIDMILYEYDNNSSNSEVDK